MMEFVLWFLLFLIVYTYIGYPLTMIVISFFAVNTIDKKQNDEDWPSASLLIAAYNEENFIAEKIKNSLDLDYPKDKFEIVVVSDGSTDRTDEIVKSFANFGVKLLRVEGRVGKTEARNQAVLQCQSDIIVFSDATAVYKEDAIKKLIRNFNDPTVGMVSGNLVYVDKSAGGMGLATKIYWTYESAIKQAQSKLYTLTGAIGCINAFRRKLYHVLPPNIIEDFTEPLMIVAQDYRIVYEKEAISFERTTQKPSQEFHMRVRVIRGGMKGFLYAFRRLKSNKHALPLFQLIGHKVLRWLMPVFLLILLVFNGIYVTFNQNSFFNFLMVAQLVCYLLALIGIKWKIPGAIGKLASIPAYFVVVNAASLKALYLTMTQDLEATWETNTY